MAAVLSDESRARAREAFLASLAKTCNVTASVRVADVSRDSVYAWRRADPVFAAAWDDAVEEATDALEAEARRRALDGWEVPIVRDGVVVGTMRQYSDRLMEIMLKGRRPKVFGDRLDVTGGAELRIVAFLDMARVGRADAQGALEARVLPALPSVSTPDVSATGDVVPASTPDAPSNAAP